MVHTDVGLHRGLCHRNGTDLERHMYQWNNFLPLFLVPAYFS